MEQYRATLEGCSHHLSDEAALLPLQIRVTMWTPVANLAFEEPALEA
jgi:hypothetical protein